MYAMTSKRGISETQYCHYYQARIARDQAWFFVAIARGYEHVMFDRTLDVSTSTFEFFVPLDMEQHFLEIMHTLQQQEVVFDMRKMHNRLLDPAQTV
jgi:hypothetical protein